MEPHKPHKPQTANNAQQLEPASVTQLAGINIALQNVAYKTQTLANIQCKSNNGAWFDASDQYSIQVMI